MTEIFTETLTVENVEAGLQFAISNCSEVTQIGSTQGDFVVCNVTLTALKNNVSYSGDTLAVTERAQVEQVPGWWPPPLSVIGAIGSGGLAKTGDTVSGRVAGEVPRIRVIQCCSGSKTGCALSSSWRKPWSKESRAVFKHSRLQPAHDISM